MYTIQKEWKASKISVPKLESFVKENSLSYVGCSANSKLELHFSSEPSQEEKDTIEAYYESLDGSDYVSAIEMKAQEDELEAAIQEAKVALITKTWANMSVAERKIVVGLKPTRSEMGL